MVFTAMSKRQLSRMSLNLTCGLALVGMMGCPASPPNEEPNASSEIVAQDSPAPEPEREPTTEEPPPQDVTPKDWLQAEITHVFQEHEEFVERLVFSPDGQRLVTAGLDAVKVWNVESGELLRDLEEPGSPPDSGLTPVPVTAMAVSPDGETLATVTSNRGQLTIEDPLILWNLDSGEVQQQLGDSEGCQDVVFTPDGEKLWAACGSEIRLWSLATGQVEQRLGEGIANAIALSPDGQTLATVALKTTAGAQGDDSTQVQLWDVGFEEVKQLGTLEGSGRITHAEFTADGQYLVTQTPAIQHEDWSKSPGQVVIWDWQQQTRRYEHEHLTESSVALSPDGILAGNFPEGIFIDLAGNPVDYYILMDGTVGSQPMALSPDGGTLAAASQRPYYTSSIVSLWKAGAAMEPTHASLRNDRNQYTSLDLPGDCDSGRPSDCTTEDIEAFTKEHFGFSERVGIEEETFTLNMPETNRAEAILLLSSIPDGSLFAMRYRLEFDLQEDGVTWELVWAGRQQQCSRGPTGYGEWTTQPCT